LSTKTEERSLSRGLVSYRLSYTLFDEMEKDADAEGEIEVEVEVEVEDESSVFSDEVEVEASEVDESHPPHVPLNLPPHLDENFISNHPDCRWVLDNTAIDYVCSNCHRYRVLVNDGSGAPGSWTGGWSKLEWFKGWAGVEGDEYAGWRELWRARYEARGLVIYAGLDLGPRYPCNCRREAHCNDCWLDWNGRRSSRELQICTAEINCPCYDCWKERLLKSCGFDERPPALVGLKQKRDDAETNDAAEICTAEINGSSCLCYDCRAEAREKQTVWWQEARKRLGMKPGRF
jgi:hypothetical protein